MKVWKLTIEPDKYDWLDSCEEIPFELIHSFDGRRQIQSWKELKFKRMGLKNRRGLCDYPGAAYCIPVFSQKAVEILIPYISLNYYE